MGEALVKAHLGAPRPLDDVRGPKTRMTPNLSVLAGQILKSSHIRSLLWKKTKQKTPQDFPRSSVSG